jgi:hypothetical protein
MIVWIGEEVDPCYGRSSPAKYRFDMKGSFINWMPPVIGGELLTENHKKYYDKISLNEDQIMEIIESNR